jgi:hypothetical protein
MDALAQFRKDIGKILKRGNPGREGIKKRFLNP